MNSIRKLPASIIGLVFGLSMTLIDILVLRWLDISITLQDEDAFGLALVVFGLTYGLLGYIAGHLFAARKALAQDKLLIERQLHALKQSQQQLLHYEKLAMIGQLAAGVAHEVRNPLAVIKSSVALIVEESESLSDEGEKANRFVGAEIARLDRFISQLLDFSAPTVLQLDEHGLEEIYTRIGSAWELRGQAPVPTLISKLGRRAMGFSCDIGLVTQALLALLDNAAEAAGEAGRVEVMATISSDALAIAVRDDGPGLDESSLAHLFEPFYTSKAQGTGLGLVTSQKILETHGGSITYSAGEGLGPAGRGACFAVNLPLVHEVDIKMEPAR